jgi:hypothetical protein
MCRIGKVAGSIVKKEVRAEGERGKSARAELGEFVGRQQRNPYEQCRHQNGDQGRQNPACTSHIEFDQREPTLREIAQHTARNDIAGDDEKNVHANEAGVETSDVQVEAYDRENSNGPQPVYIGPMPLG